MVGVKLSFSSDHYKLVEKFLDLDSTL